MSLSICCDFDGTICIPDSSEYLLEKFGLPGWKELDDAVWRGEITEREAFARQVSLLRVSWEEARSALHSGVRIREGFSDFMSFCRAGGIPLAILSSGLRELIDELLSRAGVSGIPVHSHQARIEGDHWTLIPWTGRRLAEHCSHCKCAYVVAEREAGKRVVYIGDGYTDLCPVQQADFVFATGRLADECRRKKQTFFPFDSFRDVEDKLVEHFHNIEQDPGR
ncbi:MtnX-like HAD-IB family phosphatase [bacterium]|nr:MtnX-like HAD-IB family phosphatase [bacterium]MBU1983425.1 MtnX-like HAD-IB family phosphatase [bacterium]